MAILRLFGRGSNPQPPPVEQVDLRSEDEDRQATAVQKRFLTQIPQIADWEQHLIYRPTSAVGGDLVDVSAMPDGRFLLTFGDVSGHGTQGALIAVSARKALHALLERVDSLADLLVNLNEDLRRDLNAGQFITAFFAVIDPQDGRLTYGSCGHPHALVVDPEGPIHLRRLRSEGMALGIAPAETLAKRLSLRQTTMVPGSLLVIYTDGLTEARNAAEEEFGEEGLMAQIVAASRQPPQVLAEQAMAAVEAHRCSPQLEDDATLFVLRRPLNQDS